MRSEDVALRLSIVVSVAGFIALTAGLYELADRSRLRSDAKDPAEKRWDLMNHGVSVKDAYRQVGIYTLAGLLAWNQRDLASSSFGPLALRWLSAVKGERGLGRST